MPAKTGVRNARAATSLATSPAATRELTELLAPGVLDLFHLRHRPEQLRETDPEATVEPLGLHEARHHCASVFIAAGVNAKALSKYLGHSSIAITFDRYGHLMPGNEGEAVALVSAYLEGRATVLRDSPTLAGAVPSGL